MNSAALIFIVLSAVQLYGLPLSPNEIPSEIPLQRRMLTLPELRERRLLAANSSNITPGMNFDLLMSFFCHIGLPPVQYQLSMETGVKETFVFDKTYPKGREDQPLYDPKDSDSSKPINGLFQSTTGGATVSGKIFQEHFRSSLDIEFEQEFGSVTKMSGFGDGVFPMDGVMGWGWDIEASTKKGPKASGSINFMHGYMQIVPTANLSFGYFTKANMAAYVSLGQLPADATYMPIPSNPLRLPALKVESFHIGEYEDHSGGWALFDTGYSVLSLPAGPFAAALKIIQPKFDWKTGLYFVDCGDKTERSPKFVFQFGGKPYRVRQIQYLLDLDNEEEKCVVAIGKSTEPNVYHLGQPFFRTYGVTFDIAGRRIGLHLATYKEGR